MSLIKRNFEEAKCTVHEPDGTVHEVANMLTFTDLRVQICKLKLTGCFVIFQGNKIAIDCNGRLQNWPDGLYDQWDNMLDELIGLS